MSDKPFRTMPVDKGLIEQKLAEKQSKLEKTVNAIKEYQEKIEDSDDRVRRFKSVYCSIKYQLESEAHYLRADIKKLENQLEVLNERGV